MTDMEIIKQAAHITADEHGKPIVQLPLDLWEEILEQIQSEATATSETVDESQPDKSNDLFVLIAQAADELDFRSGRSDISENFGDIVGNIIAEEFLKRRMEADDDQ